MLDQHANEAFWAVSDFACTSLQSLRIIDIIGATSKYNEESTHSASQDAPQRTYFADIQGSDEFGFTIGADQTVLECIADITSVRRSKAMKQCPSWLDNQIVRILKRLNEYRQQMEHATDIQSTHLQKHEIEVSSQRSAFLEATYIYLYRTLLDVPPRQVQPYVSRALHSVSEFYGVSEGNFSIWPAFIAAVEAYTAEDQAMARQWVNQICRFGMGNRKAVKQVVEELWSRRGTLSDISGLDEGSITIDWIQVMKDLNCDVLIV